MQCNYKIIQDKALNFNNLECLNIIYITNNVYFDDFENIYVILSSKRIDSGIDLNRIHKLRRIILEILHITDEHLSINNNDNNCNEIFDNYLCIPKIVFQRCQLDMNQSFVYVYPVPKSVFPIWSHVALYRPLVNNRYLYNEFKPISVYKRSAINHLLVSIYNHQELVVMCCTNQSDWGKYSKYRYGRVSHKTKFIFCSDKNCFNVFSSKPLYKNITSFMNQNHFNNCFGDIGTEFVSILYHKFIIKSKHQSKAVLIDGMSGCGKTFMINQYAKLFGLYVVSITVDGKTNNLQTHIRTTFNNTLCFQPSIVLLDNINIMTWDNDYQENFEFLKLQFSRITINHRIIIIGTSDNIHSIPYSILQLFDHYLSIPVPSVYQRFNIFRYHALKVGANKSSIDNCKQLIHDCNGLIGSDIELLCRFMLSLFKQSLRDKEVHMINPSNLSKDKNEYEKVVGETKNDNMMLFEINDLLFKDAYARCHPSGIDVIKINNNPVYWNNIGGLQRAKLLLQQTIVQPLIKRESYERLNLSFCRGILLYGPPGTGKTLLARAVATEANANFISVSTADLVHSGVGDSEKYIRDLFDKANALSPCILFIDEFQSAFSSKRGNLSHLTNELLNQMDGITRKIDCHVIVLAATNILEAVDIAFLRSGRFEKQIYIGLPNNEDRYQILLLHRQRMKWHDNVNIEELTKLTNNFTGADLTNLCQHAGFYALSRWKYESRHMNLNHCNDVDIVIDDCSIEMDDFRICLHKLKKKS